MAIAPTHTPTQAEMDLIIQAQHWDPFSLLGMHTDPASGQVVVRTFQLAALSVTVIDRTSGKVMAELEKLAEEGFFSGVVEGVEKHFVYQLHIRYQDSSRTIDDPYSFSLLLDDADLYYFAEGTHWRSYNKFGAHPYSIDSVTGTRFVVWAPNATRVAVVGDFNFWDGRHHPMRCRHDCGIWELFIPGVNNGALYKYEIRGPDFELLPLKADPYGFAAEYRPGTASKVQSLENFTWHDSLWMEERERRNRCDAPMSIYEVHAGSWRRVVEQGNRVLNFRELADQLIPYVLDMGFTHIQLMPISEYPFDGSWGYQPIGLFALTSRYGTAEDFQYFVDCCHRANLGLLLDWVPGHFPDDKHGLSSFDGTCLYEHADPRQGSHPDWKTLIYNYGRPEVANFLVASAQIWLDRYHVDGLRVDAVASMLYLNYSREEGQWIPNKFGGNENLEAVVFLRTLNEQLYRQFPGVMTVAEESTAWPGVSKPTHCGGLGFGYKWNMGWMNDTLQYMRRDCIHRRYHHNEMTFGLVYSFAENFILPLSHDEVVHGKGSLLSRMPGDTWQQFANLRAYFGFMWTHPGKKLLFMGGEFAQRQEWNFEDSLYWDHLASHWHSGVQQLIRDLNRLYCAVPALYQRDCEATGFIWLDCDNADQSLLAFLRIGNEGTEPVVVISNFTPECHHGYRMGVPVAGFYAERINTDAACYGGSNCGNGGGLHSEPIPWQGQPYSMVITVPPLATVVFEKD